ncbi:enoyl-CoA hydratase/isomerase family protein [Halostagnicola kamekurae]|uniref:Enoyl-CoA hydratase/carnithine racemase n=1 Tax=Halostagnicola kamekurae TaxID=619731 RepID=A0A1I6UP13_9EURY|nr:enoyl-CoA hydratase/isomerase family protein [Halostagnicola kamekurae]SFT03094.1 Enoyl-CoA hydratase/carnithine racemase [Halostagnicola kamekurae]
MLDTNFETIRWSFDQELKYGTITLDRPESLNALSKQLRREYATCFRELQDRIEEGHDIRAVIVNGAGDRAFSVGADVNDSHDVPAGVSKPGGEYELAEEFSRPVIAKIDGYCLGGGLEMALSCDFRFASERSTLGQPEIDLGIIPGGGGTQRLAELAGPSRAKELCMTGKHISAEEAKRDGIVNESVPADNLNNHVIKFVRTISEKPPLAVQAVKDAVNASFATDRELGRLYEHRTSRALRYTDDHEEGVRAFREDIEPEWMGR